MSENKSLNPVGITGIGDPFVLRASDGKYYMYATSFFPAEGREGFNVWQSGDLVRWSAPVQCYAAGERSFGYKDFWAPEVRERGGKFYMHYSARRKEDESLRIGVAVSASPLGPFTDVFDRQPMFDFGYAAIDGHVFFDNDGKIYFYYSRECSEYVVGGRHESHIYVADMDESLTRIASPRELFGPSLPYERKQIAGMDGWAWNEGPFVVKKEGLYYLFYSANFFAGGDYCICYAVSDRPDGGFVKAEKPLFVSKEGKISGPGHNCVFTDGKGELWCAYHVHTRCLRPDHDRQMFLDKIYIGGGRVRSDGPTLREEKNGDL